MNATIEGNILWQIDKTKKTSHPNDYLDIRNKVSNEIKIILDNVEDINIDEDDI